MRLSPMYHPPKGEECETSVEHGLPLWAETAVGYCSRRPRPSPIWGSRFVGARALGPWVGEQKPLGKTPLGGNPSFWDDLPTYLKIRFRHITILHRFGGTSLHHRHLIRVVSGGSHGWGCTSTCTWCNLHWRNCTCIRRMRGRVRRLPGGGENIFREGIVVPQRRGVLLCTGPWGRRL